MRDIRTIVLFLSLVTAYLGALLSVLGLLSAAVGGDFNIGVQPNVPGAYLDTKTSSGRIMMTITSLCFGFLSWGTFIRNRERRALSQNREAAAE